jgi:hypothetical protein
MTLPVVTTGSGLIILPEWLARPRGASALPACDWRGEQVPVAGVTRIYGAAEHEYDCCAIDLATNPSAALSDKPRGSPVKEGFGQ